MDRASAGTLVVGQSHVEAVASAVRESHCPDVTVVNLKLRDRSLSLAEKLELGGLLPASRPFRLVVSMMGGNFHNVFGLIENPIPFDFAEPGETVYAPGVGRRYVTYELLKTHFEAVMLRGVLPDIVTLRGSCPGPFVHVISPPPIQDDRHIAEHPGSYFRDKVHLGIAPAQLRLRLYRLHSRVLAEFCAREAIPVLEPPQEAVTPDGFLERRFWNRDPTHGNSAYGQLLLERFRAMVQP